MVTMEDYGQYKTTWCPGCGNPMILTAVKQALVGLGLAPHQVLIVSGIGQAAKSPHYMSVNAFNGLHGRSLPAATGAKLANSELTVLVQSGDGCHYGEGGNHFLAAIRRNVDLTVLAHNDQVSGLTKGQASPTSELGFGTKAQAGGVVQEPFNPVAVAVTMNAGFVARGFSGQGDHLAELIRAGIEHKGLALIDIMQPCPSFNKVNSFRWYKERATPLPEGYDPTDRELALRMALRWGDEIPIGVIYRSDRPAFEAHVPALQDGPLVRHPHDPAALSAIMGGFA